MAHRLAVHGVWIFALGMFLGCSGGPRTYPVSGSVKMDGKPLAGATVSFFDSSRGYTAIGLTNEAGEFKLAYFAKEGAPAGSFKVAISKAGPSTKIEGLSAELVPARYNKATELTAQVTAAGPNSFTFDHLTSELDEKDQAATLGGVPAEDSNAAEQKDDLLLDELDRNKKDQP